LREGIAIEPATYKSGQLTGALFWTLAAKRESDTSMALEVARRDLPIPGQPLWIGACGCLALIVEGLAILGRNDEIADLESTAEYVLSVGPLCVYSQHLLRTSAGIVAAAARNWTRAEEHHRAAIYQADSAPYAVAQPTARFWYADMLLARGDPGDRDGARSLLGEALRLYESIGMPSHARRTAEKIATRFAM
jgi:hypothetical protein